MNSTIPRVRVPCSAPPGWTTISGVSIDEEAINMISLQRIFQATARYIATIQEMLDTLVSL